MFVSALPAGGSNIFRVIGGRWVLFFFFYFKGVGAQGRGFCWHSRCGRPRRGN